MAAKRNGHSYDRDVEPAGGVLRMNGYVAKWVLALVLAAYGGKRFIETGSWALLVVLMVGAALFAWRAWAEQKLRRQPEQSPDMPPEG